MAEVLRSKSRDCKWRSKYTAESLGNPSWRSWHSTGEKGQSQILDKTLDWINNCAYLSLLRSPEQLEESDIQSSRHRHRHRQRRKWSCWFQTVHQSYSYVSSSFAPASRDSLYSFHSSFHILRSSKHTSMAINMMMIHSRRIPCASLIVVRNMLAISCA